MPGRRSRSARVARLIVFFNSLLARRIGRNKIGGVIRAAASFITRDPRVRKKRPRANQFSCVVAEFAIEAVGCLAFLHPPDERIQQRGLIRPRSLTSKTMIESRH